MTQTVNTEHWTVGEVADLTRVSVRTLHHYDAVGLLRPSERSEAGYRLYTAPDLRRLHRILTLRDLGFALADITSLLDADEAGQRRALEMQAALLREQLAATRRRLRAVTSLLQEDKTMNTQDIKTLFDNFDHSQYEAETKERWGDTEAYRQSAERMKGYGPAETERMKTEGAEIQARYAALLAAGTAPDSPEAAEVAEAQRAYFDRWFYDCSPEMLKNVSHVWVDDPRFTANLDRVRPGLAAYQFAAVQAWADALT